jgi:hypothetical protein
MRNVKYWRSSLILLATLLAAQSVTSIEGQWTGLLRNDSGDMLPLKMKITRATGAIVYDWCYPLLTAEQKQTYQVEEVRLAKEMEVGYPPVDGGYLTGHSSEWMILRDLLSAGVAATAIIQT